jgi:hypothetical protein
MRNAGFQTIYDDTPQSTYQRKVAPGRYHFIDVIDMDDACGSDNEGQPKYVAELSEVDLAALPPETINAALKSCGLDAPDATGEAGIAEAVFQYGAKAPLHSVSTGSRDRGFRECRKESYTLTRDAGAYEAAMNRTVNRIGSTAREYMQGNTNAAIARGLLAGKPEARLMVKMSGIDPDEATARVHAADDPPAFLAGYMTGEAGAAKDEAPEGDTLAPAYVAGFEWGVRVHAGKATRPDFIK